MFQLYWDLMDLDLKILLALANAQYKINQLVSWSFPNCNRNNAGNDLQTHHLKSI